VEHVKRVPQHGAVDDYFIEICTMALKNGDKTRAQGILERIIGHTGNKVPDLSEQLAQSYKTDGLYTKAYKYFFKSMNAAEIAFCLSKVMESGYESEQELFVARTVLDVLAKAKDKDLTNAKIVRNHFSNLKLTLQDGTQVTPPVLNFIDFLFAAIEFDDFALVKQMAG